MQEFEILERKVFYPNQLIFDQGQKGDCAYLVQSGQVRIDKTVNGRVRVLGHAGEGCIFGEMALIDRAPRMAAAIATQETTCVVIPEKVFVQRMADLDPFVRAMIRIFVNNIRSLAEQKY